MNQRIQESPSHSGCKLHSCILSFYWRSIFFRRDEHLYDLCSILFSCRPIAFQCHHPSSLVNAQPPCIMSERLLICVVGQTLWTLQSASSARPGRAAAGALSACRSSTITVEARGIKTGTNICSAKQHVRPSRRRQNRQTQADQPPVYLSTSVCLLGPASNVRLWRVFCSSSKLQHNFNAAPPNSQMCAGHVLSSLYALYMNISIQVLCL